MGKPPFLMLPFHKDFPHFGPRGQGFLFTAACELCDSSSEAPLVEAAEGSFLDEVLQGSHDMEQMLVTSGPALRHKL